MTALLPVPHRIFDKQTVSADWFPPGLSAEVATDPATGDDLAKFHQSTGEDLAIVLWSARPIDALGGEAIANSLHTAAVDPVVGAWSARGARKRFLCGTVSRFSWTRLDAAAEADHRPTAAAPSINTCGR